MKKIICFLILSIMVTVPKVVIGKINDGAGTTAATFLNIGTGGRPSGMAGAFTGIADDINSIYYNPAGIAEIKSFEFSAQQIMWLENISYRYLALGKGLSTGGLGFSFGYLSMDDLEGRTADTDSYTEFEANDTLIGLSYATGGKKIKGGINLKLINQKLEEESASAYAADFGLKFKKFPIEKTQAGISIQNVGTKIKFISEEAPLPLNIKLGVGYKFSHKLLLGLDFNMPKGENNNISLGAEYLIPISSLQAFLRAGYKTDSNFDTADNLRAGMGLRWTSYIVDFAWSPYGNLGNAYRISLQGQF